VKKAAIFRAYQKETINRPHLDKTAFYNLCPQHWVSPTFQRCVCGQCHVGLDAVLCLEKTLQVTLPSTIRRSKKGYGIHTPRLSPEIYSSKEDEAAALY